ncbi:MAG: hypothetical protein H8E17_12380 [Deltaproteobacteria bacterium]|nr:hypothetical protein [Deltaproteobacteria bacterium]
MPGYRAIFGKEFVKAVETMQPKKVKLRKTHWDQIISYAKHFEEKGFYYGNKKQFLKRHKEIMDFLTEQLKKGV